MCHVTLRSIINLVATYVQIDTVIILHLLWLVCQVLFAFWCCETEEWQLRQHRVHAGILQCNQNWLYAASKAPLPVLNIPCRLVIFLSISHFSDLCLNGSSTGCNISNTRRCVLSDIQTLRIRFKKWGAAEFLKKASKCLDIWWNMVLSVWYGFWNDQKFWEKSKAKVGKISW